MRYLAVAEDEGSSHALGEDERHHGKPYGANRAQQRGAAQRPLLVAPLLRGRVDDRQAEKPKQHAGDGLPGQELPSRLQEWWRARGSATSRPAGQGLLDRTA